MSGKRICTNDAHFTNLNIALGDGIVEPLHNLNGKRFAVAMAYIERFGVAFNESVDNLFSHRRLTARAV